VLHLSGHLLRQILDPTSSETDYLGVGILLSCINRPFIRNKIIPDASYVRDWTEVEYWGQGCPEDDGNSDFGKIGSSTAMFLLARDVPVPSLGSGDELETTWKLIKWRNSITVRKPIQRWDKLKVEHQYIWPEIFSDIRGYSPEFLEGCLCHFRTWTSVQRHCPSGLQDYAGMFDSIV
jgi:hypothetical protein